MIANRPFPTAGDDTGRNNLVVGVTLQCKTGWV